MSLRGQVDEKSLFSFLKSVTEEEGRFRLHTNVGDNRGEDGGFSFPEGDVDAAKQQTDDQLAKAQEAAGGKNQLLGFALQAIGKALAVYASEDPGAALMTQIENDLSRMISQKEFEFEVERSNREHTLAERELESREDLTLAQLESGERIAESQNQTNILLREMIGEQELNKIEKAHSLMQEQIKNTHKNALELVGIEVEGRKAVANIGASASVESSAISAAGGIEQAKIGAASREKIAGEEHEARRAEQLSNVRTSLLTTKGFNVNAEVIEEISDWFVHGLPDGKDLSAEAVNAVAILPKVKRANEIDQIALAASLEGSVQIPIMSFNPNTGEFRTLTNSLTGEVMERQANIQEITAFLAGSTVEDIGMKVAALKAGANIETDEEGNFVGSDAPLMPEAIDPEKHWKSKTDDEVVNDVVSMMETEGHAPQAALVTAAELRADGWISEKAYREIRAFAEGILSESITSQDNAKELLDSIESNMDKIIKARKARRTLKDRIRSGEYASENLINLILDPKQDIEFHLARSRDD